MSIKETVRPGEDVVESVGRTTLRLWPGVVIVALMWFARYVLPVFVPEALQFGVLGGVLGGTLGILVWWLFFSKTTWAERLSVIALLVVLPFITSFFIDKSISTAMMGFMFPFFVIPFMGLALVLGAAVGRRASSGVRIRTIAVSILVACVGFTLVRTDGMYFGAHQDFAWRWSATAEEKFLAQAEDAPANLSTAALALDSEADWPGFRGPHRDGVVRGVRIETDWGASPPVELWRRPVGPGVSSFAVQGDFFYTQEQRGDEELVTCYNLTTGEPIWKHSDETRFWESHAGAGPRATPSLSKGRVYTFGATGLVSALNASDGSVIWSRDATSDVEVKLPPLAAWYGFSNSPLIVDSLVVISVSGALVAYDADSGEPRWTRPQETNTYSSPHLLTIDNVRQILLMADGGATSVSPADGALLWEHKWSTYVRIAQPALMANGDLVLSAGEGNGLRRISISQEGGAWKVEERWTSNRLKPYHSDFVVHNGHAYGFDGNILACVDLEDGKRKWKGGRYGAGQVVIHAEQNVLMALSENGELVLVEATAENFNELARFPAIEGKTWNHPALADDILLVRNAKEMAAFRLSVASY